MIFWENPAHFLNDKEYKVPTKRKGSEAKTEETVTNFQEFSPSGVTQDVFNSLSNELRQLK